MPLLIISAIFIVAILSVIALYARDHRAQLRRVRSSGMMIDTACGRIEYTTYGTGFPVLALHGGGGGYDQGAMLGRMLANVQVIAPSRAGYLGTPLEIGGSHSDQAGAAVALLDALGVEKAMIVGASAGGPVALQIARRYPQRCAGLVMLSAVSQPLSLNPEYLRFARLLFSADFLPWLAARLNLKQAIRNNGPLPPEAENDPHKMALLREMIEYAITASLRYRGIINDLSQNDEENFAYSLDLVRVPTLVIHGVKDPIVPLSHGEHSAQGIPNARYIRIEGSGHLCFITHSEQVTPAIDAFIAERFAA